MPPEKWCNFVSNSNCESLVIDWVFLRKLWMDAVCNHHENNIVFGFIEVPEPEVSYGIVKPQVKTPKPQNGSRLILRDFLGYLGLDIEKIRYQCTERGWSLDDRLRKETSTCNSWVGFLSSTINYYEINWNEVNRKWLKAVAEIGDTEKISTGFGF